MTTANNRLRVGFTMELVLGHVTWYQNLRRSVESLDIVDSAWVETTLHNPQGLLERTPGVPGVVRAGARAWLDMHRGLNGFDPDVLVFNTQKAAMFSQWDMLRTPSILMTDVTPLQYDRLAQLYDHTVDESAAIRAAKHAINVVNFRLAAALAVCSTWVRDSLVTEYGVPEDRVHIIPIGVDTEYWSSGPQTTTRERPRLLFVGGHFERKGGHLLLDVFRALGLHERAELHIVTRDAIEPEPGVFVHRGMQNNSPELRQLYRDADAFVLPTLADCFGNASLEAMGIGLPVITTAMGGIPDIVAHGETGFLLEPGNRQQLADAVKRLVDDADMRRSFGRAARERAVAQFDGQTNAARLLELAGQLAHSRGRASRTRLAVDGFRTNRNIAA
jgi:hypothetical protein